MLKPSYYTEPTDVDRMIFGKLVPETHLLRQLDEVIDFEATRALMADCYSARMGRGAEDPVRMLKLCMLQFFYDLSDDDVIEQAPARQQEDSATHQRMGRERIGAVPVTVQQQYPPALPGKAHRGRCSGDPSADHDDVIGLHRTPPPPPRGRR